jgi:hypothetical protein
VCPLVGVPDWFAASSIPLRALAGRTAIGLVDFLDWEPRGRRCEQGPGRVARASSTAGTALLEDAGSLAAISFDTASLCRCPFPTLAPDSPWNGFRLVQVPPQPMFNRKM